MQSESLATSKYVVSIAVN